MKNYCIAALAMLFVAGAPARAATQRQLDNVASGTTARSEAECTGDYSPIVTPIMSELCSFGSTNLRMQMVVRDSHGIEYGLTDAITIGMDAGMWHAATFELTPSGLRLISADGSEIGTLEANAADAGELRTTPVPEPASFGLLAAACLGAMSRRCSISFFRRRKA